MIDPELKYCPKCDDEYRADIARCAGCGVPLITGRQRLEMEEQRRRRLEGRDAELSAEDDMVNLRKGPLGEMRHLENLLRAERIPALLVGDESSCGKGCCASTFYLQVRRQDAMDAVGILEAEHRRATGLCHHDTTHADSVFDPEAGEAVCPACGHAFPTTTSECPECGLCFG